MQGDRLLKIFQRHLPDVVTVNINCENISFACFQSKKNNDLFILSKYKCWDIQDYFIYNLEIFNFNLFKNYFDIFINANKIKNPFIYISLSSDQISESLTDSSDIGQNNDSYIVNSQEFLINNKKFFYTTKIKHSIIFQYKLFAIKYKINLLKIISDNLINLKLLKHYNCAALGNISNIEDIQYEFKNFIDSCNIKNYMIVSDPSININFEKQYLMKNLGIFLLRDLL